jgi:hypothetical protein
VFVYLQWLWHSCLEGGSRGRRVEEGRQRERVIEEMSSSQRAEALTSGAINKQRDWEVGISVFGDKLQPSFLTVSGFGPRVQTVRRVCFREPRNRP